MEPFFSVLSVQLRWSWKQVVSPPLSPERALYNMEFVCVFCQIYEWISSSWLLLLCCVNAVVHFLKEWCVPASLRTELTSQLALSPDFGHLCSPPLLIFSLPGLHWLLFLGSLVLGLLDHLIFAGLYRIYFSVFLGKHWDNFCPSLCSWEVFGGGLLGRKKIVFIDIH